MNSTENPRLPVAALLALALAGFVTILTEALPAGLLPLISTDLKVSEALAGQLVTVYAAGSLLAAIPLIALTRRARRRPLLLTAIAGFLLANTVTAWSASYGLTLAARFVAGMSAGLLWALVAGYAVRMVAEHQKGRAIAIAMVGAPLAMALGIPAGTALGNLVGWRMCFGLMSVLALALMVWVRLGVPDFPGQPAQRQRSLAQVFTTAGVRPVLFVVLGFVLAHNILYTYIAPYLAAAAMAERTDLVLLVFGATSLLGIWITGVLIDRHLRTLALLSTLLFGAAALVLGVAGTVPVMVYVAVAAWGLAFGGAPTLLQTSLANTAGDAADVAQSMLVTAWNLAIAGGGMLGGLLLERYGVVSFPPALLLLLSATLVVVWLSRQQGFPVIRPDTYDPVDLHSGDFAPGLSKSRD